MCNFREEGDEKLFCWLFSRKDWRGRCGKLGSSVAGGIYWFSLAFYCTTAAVPRTLHTFFCAKSATSNETTRGLRFWTDLDISIVRSGALGDFVIFICGIRGVFVAFSLGVCKWASVFGEILLSLHWPPDADSVCVLLGDVHALFRAAFRVATPGINYSPKLAAATKSIVCAHCWDQCLVRVCYWVMWL